MGRHHSEESRIKMSKTHKGMDNHQRGKHYKVSDETRRKVSVSLIGNKRAKGNKSRKGCKVSDEARHKMSESAKRRCERERKLKENITFPIV